MPKPSRQTQSYAPLIEKTVGEDGLAIVSPDADVLDGVFMDGVISARSESLWRRYSTWIIFISITLNFVLALTSSFLFYVQQEQNPNLFWTPFNSHLRYHIQVFKTGFGTDKSIYQAPASEQKDIDWEDLYVEAFTIPKKTAAKQINKTAPISDEPDAPYITSFSVMHYLHCMDMIRRTTDVLYYPEYYNMSSSYNPFTHPNQVEGFEDGGMYSEEHISHCIDSVRQALQCMPDLSPVVWQWNPKVQKTQVWAQTAHTCANWDDVYAFANASRLDDDFEQGKALEEVGKCGYYDEEPCGI